MADVVQAAVVIPTYQRPDWLARAVGSLAKMTRRPAAVIAVCRDSDRPSHDAVVELRRQHAADFEVSMEQVTAPGHIPPVALGLRVGAERAPVVAVMDDDAEAEPEWLERLLARFADTSVGAVGGRCVNITNGVPVPVPTRSVFGRLDYWGRVMGNMYCEPDVETPREADFLMGGNMAYRREVIQRLEFDLRLNAGVAFNYEVDLGLQVRNLGYRVVFDPTARIKHFSAPRANAGMRRSDADSVRDYARNLVLILGRRLPAARRLRTLGFFLLVGDRTAWGPGSAVADLALTRRLRSPPTFLASQRGKLEGLAALLSRGQPA